MAVGVGPSVVRVVFVVFPIFRVVVPDSFLGYDLGDFGVNVFVEFLLCDGSFASDALAGRLDEVHVIETKRHRSQDDIDALE